MPSIYVALFNHAAHEEWDSPPAFQSEINHSKYRRLSTAALR
jgi:hypothetical protein